MSSILRALSALTIAMLASLSLAPGVSTALRI
eukprot:CAMPEP_0173419672 /NCGR_PEP_ID=MMETSP1357-20121228/1421_1 /TAXON_ID=77926 /ORGANISM="Hemiselmis rufescens, Strain PCC563" /LENGTH=31 /DNA_ID= /DNA_START= /DNA_END= /DNA_ORIENTATION=